MTPFASETARCRAAQRTWNALSLRSRLEHVHQMRHLLVTHADRLGTIVSDELQRPADELIATDLLPTAAAAKYLERHAARLLAPRHVGGRPLWLFGCRDRIDRVPRGVVGMIGTWNYPIFLNMVPMLHAFTAGNGVVWKPSERMPRTAAAIDSLFALAGFPPDLLLQLPATREGGAELAQADIDYLHFTGSEAVGRKLAAKLGERLVPSALELSGCDAMFVLEDANVELAAKLAWYGTTLNRGQTCMAVRRVFAIASVYERFASALRACGDNANIILNPEGTCGLAANREATFEPRIVVNRVPDLEVALSMWAESNLALTASIFTANRRAAEQLAKRLCVGTVVINDVIVPTAHPGTPFGGRGASGWGVSQGDEGLLEMTLPQVVTFRSGNFRPHADTKPGSSDIVRGVLRATHGDGIRERFAGLRQIWRGMRG